MYRSLFIMNAMFYLPVLFCVSEVGFKVGGDTGVDYLVLQVHYKDVTTFLPPCMYTCINVMFLTILIMRTQLK